MTYGVIYYIIYCTYTIIYLISYLILYSPFLSQYSFYTCRCLLLDTYISSMFISCSSFLSSLLLFSSIIPFLPYSSIPSFTILFISIFLSFPSSYSSHLPFLLSFPVYLSSVLLIPILLNLSSVPLPFSSSIFPIFHQPHSKYTCRYLHILIYIPDSSPKLTPHVLSEWMVEVCRF